METQHSETGRSARHAFDAEWSYSPRVSTLFGAFTAIAVFGWVVSAFLSGIHFWAIPQIPAGAELSGSLQVVTSSWAYVFGVPLATLGAFYYLTTIVLSLWWFDTRHPLIVKILTPITATGVLASAYFVYLQLGVIGEICPFCMMSATASVLLFGLELSILRTSDFPATTVLVGDVGELLDRTRFRWLAVAAAMGLLTLAAFYGVTLAPVPGT
ncbi:vitamin K epoxide reductase [Halorubrum sp. JWXQ-INN 858]|uniref:vitamin K epoxide reductase family protein n=1 Tax=Halorubrum sp. JWXQ-INN 858 TaxID=2690782 RepID=UPI0013575159|nr:vitamin K epoxide reductase family protein [Halorubrum sp. JWXQ-INN 858]MWV64462.1 vitamin K epoxide reductase [Halorubrum sp. JWXQ-INN 858]